MNTSANATDFTAMSRLTAEIDLQADGKAHGFVRVPHSVHRSAYGWIPIPAVCLKNGDGPTVLLSSGNHGDEYGVYQADRHFHIPESAPWRQRPHRHEDA